MHVQDFMTTRVHRCMPDDSLADAAQLMWQHDFGCVPVCTSIGNGSEHLVGILTDRDICMCALFQGKPLGELRVKQAMTTRLRCCGPDDTLEYAQKLMSDGQIRRLPVVNAERRLVGLVSLADLARGAATLGANFTLAQKEAEKQQVFSILAAISGRPAQVSLA
jgi:CBS domain-containing protein